MQEEVGEGAAPSEPLLVQRAGSHGRTLSQCDSGRGGLVSDLKAVREILFSSYINALLVFVPLSFVSAANGWGAVQTFTFSFLSLIPLALILGDVTEDLALRSVTQPSNAELDFCFAPMKVRRRDRRPVECLFRVCVCVNIECHHICLSLSFISCLFLRRNIVEIILSIAALQRCLFTVVATSLLGSILSNLLLVLGFCFFFGGMYYKTQARALFRDRRYAP